MRRERRDKFSFIYDNSLPKRRPRAASRGDKNPSRVSFIRAALCARFRLYSPRRHGSRAKVHIEILIGHVAHCINPPVHLGRGRDGERSGGKRGNRCEREGRQAE